MKTKRSSGDNAIIAIKGVETVRADPLGTSELIFDARDALAALKDEITDKVSLEIGTLKTLRMTNQDYHVELTLAVSEIRVLLKIHRRLDRFFRRKS